MQNFSQYLTCRSMLAKKQGKGFSETEAKEILRQVLAQLNTLHERRQSHGSISLDTIAYDQKRMVIVLLPSNGRNNPIYLAPEVVQTRQATPTADIYAVAIVMIVLLTGSPPEELKTATDMWNWEERCNISDRFIQILNIALSATRDFRYVNAGQMIRSLKPIIAIPDPKIDLTRINPAIASASVSQFQNDISRDVSQDDLSLPTVAEASQYLNPVDPIFAAGIIVGGLLSVLILYRFVELNTTKNLQTINGGDLDKAIARVYETKKAEENIDKLLVLAKYKYEYSGNLSEAETMLQSIPSELPTRIKADQLLVQWQEDQKKNSAVIQQAENALKNGNWQLAIDSVKTISPTPYWQERGKMIAEDAKQKLAGINTRTNSTANNNTNPENTLTPPASNPASVAAIETPRDTSSRDAAPTSSDNSQPYIPPSSARSSSRDNASENASENASPNTSSLVVIEPTPPRNPPAPSSSPPVFSTPPASAAPPAPRVAN